MGPKEDEEDVDTQPFDRAELDALLRASSRPPPDTVPDVRSGSVMVIDGDGDPD
jgi:hypothetical protein